MSTLTPSIYRHAPRAVDGHGNLMFEQIRAVVTQLIQHTPDQILVEYLIALFVEGRAAGRVSRCHVVVIDRHGDVPPLRHLVHEDGVAIVDVGGVVGAVDVHVERTLVGRRAEGFVPVQVEAIARRRAVLTRAKGGQAVREDVWGRARRALEVAARRVLPPGAGFRFLALLNPCDIFDAKCR